MINKNVNVNKSYIIVKLHTGNNYNICEYQEVNYYQGNTSKIMSNFSDFAEMYLIHPFKYERYSYRQYGEPKLQKPAELKNIKQSFSVDYIPKKCSCPCFILNDDLYIHHRDFFSGSLKFSTYEDNSMPLEPLLKKYFGKDKKYRQNVYPDTWGDIVLRNEAYLVFRNIKQLFKRELSENSNKSYAASLVRDRMLVEFMKSDKIAYENMHDYTELELEWERFFEGVCNKYMQTVFNEQK